MQKSMASGEAPRPANILVAISPTLGGRALGATVGDALPGHRVTVVEDLSEDTDALTAADVVMTAHVPIGAVDLDRAPQLGMIQCPSHGFDDVDVEAAAGRGIPVCNVTSGAAEEHDVADHAIMLMLAVTRRLVAGHQALIAGDWPLVELRTAGLTSLREKTLGIVGFGTIGRQVAERAAAFGMNIVYTSRRRVDADLTGGSVAEYCNLDDLLARSDVVTLHLPLNSQTKNLVDERRLKLMKPSAFLINTARGGVVDQAALARALSSGRLAGAGIDVFDPEPPPPDHPLLHSPNVVLSPHIAASTSDALPRIERAALDNVRRYLDGNRLLDIVNGVKPARA